MKKHFFHSFPSEVSSYFPHFRATEVLLGTDSYLDGILKTS